MIHELSIFFTNYDSWQYTVTALGLVIVGGGLTAWKVYFLPLLVTGEIMLLALLNNQVSVANLKGAVGGIASDYPIIYVAFCMITDLNFKRIKITLYLYTIVHRFTVISRKILKIIK